MSPARRTLARRLLAVLAAITLVAATTLLASQPARAITGTIYVSQLGFGLSDAKFALLGTGAGTPLDETAFRVVRVSDSSVVHTGTVAAWTGANEWHGNNTTGDVYTLDFSAWTAAPGRYRVESNSLASFPFDVGNYAFHLRTWDPLSWWRVWDIGHSVNWTALDGTADSHGPLFVDDGRQGTTTDPGGGEILLQQSPAFTTGTHIPTSGGWLDAGDWNTYIGTTPWAAYLLLITYEDHKAYWNKLDADANGIPDIVDATRTALDWMLKMRGKDGSGNFDGSCYERVWKSFADYTTDGTVGNADDRPVDTDKWADLCVRMAQAGTVAYRVWDAYDPTAAATYQTMAEQAYDWASVPGQADKPQSGLGGGVYWSDLASNRALAATELYRTSCLSTCDSAYLTDATGLIDPQVPAGSWTNTANFPALWPSTWRNSGTVAMQRFHDYGYGSAGLRSDIITAMQTAYDSAITNADAGPYKVWRGGFASFGGSSIFGSLAMDAVWLYRKTNDIDYYNFALNQQGWVWGRNNMNVSFWNTNRIAGRSTTAFSELTNDKTIENFIVSGGYDRCGPNGVPDYGSSAACPGFARSNHQYGEPTINGAALNLRAMTELQFAKVPTGDVTPPSVPTGLSATPGASSITLDWADSAATDLLGYTVHRSTTSGFTPSAGTVLKRDLITSSYVDSTASPGVTYYYKVAAYDTSDNASAGSTQASAQIGGTLLFSDDFEDGNSTGWTTTSGTWSVLTDDTKVFKQSATGTNGKTSAGTAGWTDYTVQARIRMHEMSSGKATGVVARYTDDNNLYWLRLHSSGTVELYKIVGGTSTLLDSAALGVAANTWYTLALDVNGNNLVGYVNGTPLVNATDSALSSGKVGARSFQQSFSIDDVTVTAPVTTLLTDDFEDGNSTGWTTPSGSWSVVTDGTKVFKQGTAGTTGKAYAGSGWTDLTIQARIRMNELPAVTAAGITARHDGGTDSHYWLRLHHNGKVQLYRLAGGATLLDEATFPGGFNTSTWYTLRLVVSGSSTVTLTGSVDGVQYVSANDSSAGRLLSGGVGARSFQQSFSIDDVIVTSP